MWTHISHGIVLNKIKIKEIRSYITRNKLNNKNINKLRN